MQTLRVPSLRATGLRSAAAPRAPRRQVKVSASGYSREQQEFLERKARESRSASAAPAPTRGRSASPRPASPRPSSSPRPVYPSSSSSSSYSSPAPAAAGLSAEQQAFLARKATEPRAASPAPTRGRSASPRPASPRPSSRPSSSPRPASPTPAASYSAPAAGLSAEQQAFLARKASEVRPASPAPARGRAASPRPASPRPSSSPRPSFRPASPAPSSYSSSSSSSSSSSYTAPAVSYSPPAPAAPAAAGLSPEQQAFLARKAAEPRPASPTPARGRSASPRPNLRPSSSPRPASPPPAPAAAYYAPPPEVRSSSPPPTVEDARAALERSLERSAVSHPGDVPAPAARPLAVPAGPNTGRWPDPVFVVETLNAFPDKAVANPEETRALLDGGWTILDVRSELEQNARGKLRNTVIVPCVFEKQTFDAARGEMVIEEQDNPSFLTQVAKAFPNKQARIIVACSNGSRHSIDVLEALEEEGYTNLVGLKGGYNAYTRVFDFRHNPKDKRPVPKSRTAMKKLL